MWGMFEIYKEQLKEQYQKHRWVNGASKEELQTVCEKIIGEKKPFAERKTEMLCYLLRNAPIDATEGEYFLDQIGEFNIMTELRWENQKAITEQEGIQTEKEYLYDLGLGNPAMDFGHIAPDWDFLFAKGLVGVIARLQSYRKLPDRTPEQLSFYDHCIAVYEAMLDCLRRMAEVARTMGEQGAFVAENLLQLTRTPPQTLAQAMQLTFFYYYIQHHLDVVLIRSLGGIDHLYAPFYRRDLESGAFTEAQLRELTRDFLWKISAKNIVANLPFYLCGLDAEGKDQTNDYTKVILEEYYDLDLYDPKFHVMYHPNMREDVLQMMLEMIRKGHNSFVFINVAVTQKALERIGVSPEDAKRIIVYGCYEAAAEGQEIPCTCGSYFNLATAVELALHNGHSVLRPELMTVETGENFADFSAFIDAVKTQIAFLCNKVMQTLCRLERLYDEIRPSPVFSPTFLSCCEKGLDGYAGGVKYNNTSIVFSGIATLVDSCLAVKQIVFDEKKVTLAQLGEILSRNWEGEEALRLYVQKHCVKYGNNHPDANALTKEFFNFYADMVNGKPNGRGGVFRCGNFSVDTCYWLGKSTGATPDGRKAGEAISKNAAATLGADVCGVTAYLKSVLQLDGTKIPDGCVADVILHHSAVQGEEGMVAFHGLLTAYMKAGGNAVHFNILNPAVLRKAQLQPEKYQNLQIRLCGWNVHFVDLSRELQDEFILQSEKNLA